MVARLTMQGLVLLCLCAALGACDTPEDTENSGSVIISLRLATHTQAWPDSDAPFSSVVVAVDGNVLVDFDHAPPPTGKVEYYNRSDTFDLAAIEGASSIGVGARWPDPGVGLNPPRNRFWRPRSALLLGTVKPPESPVRTHLLGVAFRREGTDQFDLWIRAGQTPALAFQTVLQRLGNQEVARANEWYLYDFSVGEVGSITAEDIAGACVRNLSEDDWRPSHISLYGWGEDEHGALRGRSLGVNWTDIDTERPWVSLDPRQESSDIPTLGQFCIDIDRYTG